jgi:hypothetical protein
MIPRRLAYSVAIGGAVLVGAVVAVISNPEAEASGWHWERVDTHWHAGVWQWTDTAWWCFGYAGWHGSGGWAADVFADAYDPACNDPGTTEVRLHVAGYIGSTPYVGAIASPIVDQWRWGDDKCNVLRVRLYDYRYGTLRGYYYYYHVDSNGQYPGVLYGNNQWYWNSWSIGSTIHDYGCDWSGFHAHQTMPVQGDASSPNLGLYSDGDGKVWHMNDWIHGWIFWTWAWY